MPIILPGPTPSQPTTLLMLIQDLCIELGLNSTGRVIGSADPQILQMLALANRLGSDLVREHEWQQLTTIASIPTTGGETNYLLPADWNRQISQTEWNQSARRPMFGPLTSKQWQAYKGFWIGADVDIFFRIQGGNIVLLEPPPEGQTLAFEYISKNWIVGPSGDHYSRFLSDEDTFLFDENLMKEGLKLRWRKAKGLPYDEADYMNLLDQCKSQNKSAPQLRLGAVSHAHFLDNCNVPEGNWRA